MPRVKKDIISEPEDYTDWESYCPILRTDKYREWISGQNTRYIRAQFASEYLEAIDETDPVFPLRIGEYATTGINRIKRIIRGWGVIVALNADNPIDAYILLLTNPYNPNEYDATFTPEFIRHVEYRIMADVLAKLSIEPVRAQKEEFSEYIKTTSVTYRLGGSTDTNIEYPLREITALYWMRFNSDPYDTSNTTYDEGSCARVASLILKDLPIIETDAGLEAKKLIQRAYSVSSVQIVEIINTFGKTLGVGPSEDTYPTPFALKQYIAGI